MEMARTCLERAKRAAINHDWDSADKELQAVLLEASEEELQAIIAALVLLAVDCEKLNLTDLALWAYKWVAQLAPTYTTPYLKLAAHYERRGQRQMALEWLKRGIEMTANSSDSRQLHRAYRRVCSRR